MQIRAEAHYRSLPDDVLRRMACVASHELLEARRFEHASAHAVRTIEEDRPWDFVFEDEDDEDEDEVAKDAYPSIAQVLLRIQDDAATDSVRRIEHRARREAHFQKRLGQLSAFLVRSGGKRPSQGNTYLGAANLARLPLLGLDISELELAEWLGRCAAAVRGTAGFTLSSERVAQLTGLLGKDWWASNRKVISG